MNSSFRSLFFAACAVFAFSCSGNPAVDDDGGTGGGTGGGAAGTGGGTVTGGGSGGGATGGGSGGGTTGGGSGGGVTGGGSGGGVTGGGGGATGGGSGGGVTGGGGGATGGGSGGGATGGGSGGGGGATGGGGGATGGGGGAAGGGAGTPDGGSAIPYVFVIAMENQDSAGFIGIYGSSSAPYINNTLMMQGGHSTAFGDVLGPLVVSEPHYVWMEGGTNVYTDTTFDSDADPSASNSTNDGNHLIAQLRAAGNVKTWRSYQEGINATTGACPVASDGHYAAKHDPFVFFQDISGNPPSKTNVDCAAHHREFTPTSFQSDLNAMDVANYTFITPTLCNDMHGASGCSNGCTSGFTTSACVGAGDSWLAANVPPILAFINAHGGVLFIVWDEPALTTTIPFIVVGPHVKPNHTSTVAINHSSYVKSLERIFGVPVSSRVSTVNDFSDFFQPGYFP